MSLMVSSQLIKILKFFSLKSYKIRVQPFQDLALRFSSSKFWVLCHPYLQNNDNETTAIQFFNVHMLWWGLLISSRSRSKWEWHSAVIDSTQTQVPRALAPGVFRGDAPRTRNGAPGHAPARAVPVPSRSPRVSPGCRHPHATWFTFPVTEDQTNHAGPLR